MRTARLLLSLKISFQASVYDADLWWNRIFCMRGYWNAMDRACGYVSHY